MTFQIKNYSVAIATIMTVSSIMIAAAAQADPNPYIRDNLIVGVETKVGTNDANKQTVQKKIEVIKPTRQPSVNRVIRPGDLVQPGANEPFVKQGGPIFVKDGSQLPKVDRLNQPGANEPFVKQGGPIFVKDGSQLPKVDRLNQPGANEPFVKQGGPIFVKDGSQLPKVDQLSQPGRVKSKSFPSAVDMDKEIKSTDNY